MTKDGDHTSEATSMMTTTPDGTMLMGIPLVSAMDVVSAGEEGGVECALKEEEDDELGGVVRGDEDENAVVHPMLSVVSAGENYIRTNHTTIQSLLSTPISGSQVLAQPDGIQVITLPTSDLVTLQGEAGERYVQMVSNGTELGTKYIGLFAITNPNVISQAKGETNGLSSLEIVQGSEASELNTAAADSIAAILMPQATQQSDLPPGCPSWAMRLNKCEKIGDSFRGYVENEADLDLILTLHKQQTNSFWGTRQSPSTAKASTRLMWKSQYVPFDGIPFINAGSRAVVMECQFGPRRKGTLGKRSNSPTVSTEFKQTCPARIYIKKVRKFPAYAVNLNMDKKSIRLAMDKAFHELREQGMDTYGEERYYVQLPTDKAHDYHEEGSNNVKTELPPAVPLQEAEQPQPEKSIGARIHPAVLEKIRQLVAGGETKLYSIRKQLRIFVVRDMFQGSGHVPERHDLTMFPTVNDLKNHIHQALRDIESGILPQTTPLINSENLGAAEKESPEREVAPAGLKQELSSMWSGANVPSTSPMPETVTVTLTQTPGEDGQHIISRIETHLSDGTTQVSTTLTPETAHLLSRLYPSLFPAGCLLQLDGSQSQPPPSEAIPSSMGVLEGSGADLDASMVEGAHIIGGLDPNHLVSMVDMDNAHNISGILDADTAATISGMVSSDHSHSLPEIQLDPSSTHSIPGIMDADAANLGIVVSNPAHISNLTISGNSHMSMFRDVHSSSISEMVSSGSAQFSIVAGAGERGDAITLVSGEGDVAPGMGLVSADGDDGHMNLEGDEACAQLIPKAELGSESDSHGKMTREKITLHITSDQEIGMARLENKVSDL